MFWQRSSSTDAAFRSAFETRFTFACSRVCHMFVPARSLCFCLMETLRVPDSTSLRTHHVTVPEVPAPAPVTCFAAAIEACVYHRSVMSCLLAKFAEASEMRSCSCTQRVSCRSPCSCSPRLHDQFAHLKSVACTHRYLPISNHSADRRHHPERQGSRYACSAITRFVPRPTTFRVPAPGLEASIRLLNGRSWVESCSTFFVKHHTMASASVMICLFASNHVRCPS